MSDTLDLHRLGPPALRAAWLFQALVAGPACLLFAIAALWTVYYPYSPPFIYPAIKELFFALFAAGILYILTVQRNYPQPHPRATATFELAKGLLATAAWLWLLLDAVFYRAPWYSFPVSPKQRTVFVSVSVVVLLFVSCRHSLFTA